MRKSTIRDFDEFDGSKEDENILTDFASMKYRLDITRNMIPVMLEDSESDNLSIINSSKPSNQQQEDYSSQTQSEQPIKQESLYSQFYYKNIIFMDQEFDNQIFEIFEPEIDPEKALRREKEMQEPQPLPLRGIEHIYLSNKSIVRSIMETEDNEDLQSKIDRLYDFHKTIGKKFRDPNTQSAALLHQSMKLTDSYQFNLKQETGGKMQKKDRINEYKVINKPQDMIGGAQSDQWSGSSEHNEGILLSKYF